MTASLVPPKSSQSVHSRSPRSFFLVAVVIALVGACGPTATPTPPATPAPPATVVFETSPAGTISPSGTQTYPLGTVVDVTLRANDVAWTPGLIVDNAPAVLAAQADGSATYRLTVDGDHLLQATFAQFADNVRPIDAATVAVLVEIAPDGTKVVFSSSTPFLDALRAGDFLVDQIGSGLTEPLLVRVRAIDRSGPEVVLTTEPAKLSEVIENASVRLTVPLDFGEGQSGALDGQFAAIGPFAPAAPGRLAESHPTDLELSLYKAWRVDSGGASGTVTASGSLSVSQPALEFEWEQSSFATQRFLVALRANPVAELTVRASGSLTLEQEAQLLERDLTPVVFAVGWLPVWVNTHLEAGVGAKLEAKAAFNAGVTLSATARSGVLYQKNAGWSLISELTPRFDGQVSLAAEAAAGAYPYLRPRFNIYGLCGPYLDLRPGTAAFAASISADPWWKLDAGFEVSGGADCVFTDPWQFPLTLAASKTVAQATSPAPTPSPTPSPTLDVRLYQDRVGEDSVWAVQVPGKIVAVTSSEFQIDRCLASAGIGDQIGGVFTRAADGTYPAYVTKHTDIKGRPSGEVTVRLTSVEDSSIGGTWRATTSTCSATRTWSTKYVGSYPSALSLVDLDDQVYFSSMLCRYVIPLIPEVEQLNQYLICGGGY